MKWSLILVDIFFAGVITFLIIYGFQGMAGNLSAEIVGINVTVVVIDWAAKKREKMEKLDYEFKSDGKREN